MTFSQNLFISRDKPWIWLDYEKKQPFSSGYCCVELGYEKSRFTTNISPNLGKDTRYGHSYNGRRIGTPM